MYNYDELKHEVFTEEGYNMINKIKLNMQNNETFTVGELMKNLCGSSWTMLACIDWLVENNELRYIQTVGAKQHHILRRVR